MEHITFKQLSELILTQAKEKGFGTTPAEINVAEKIALIHSEVSEAYEAYRHNNFEGKDGFAHELGDIVQRVMHLAGALDIDLEKAILDKIEHNKERNWKWDDINESHS